MEIKHISSILSFFLLANSIMLISSKKTKSNKKQPNPKAKPNNVEHGLSDISVQCPGPPGSKKGPKVSPIQPKLIPLIDIESKDCTSNDILSKNNNNLFFVESSGRNYLTPRDTCAIESAIKNSGLAGNIIVAMTSPFLDVTANNATCHLYTEHEGKNVFFRHVNVDSIFKGTPIHDLHINGNLKHHEWRKNVVQYR